MRFIPLLLALAVLPTVVICKPVAQTNDWDSIAVGQKGLLLTGSNEEISFEENSSILWGKTVIGQCTYQSDFREGVRVYVSPVSPKKELFVVLCWEDMRGGKAGWVIDKKNRTVLAKNIVPDRWGIASWVSWSPNEDIALFHAVGEVTMGDMLFVNLLSGKSQEIHFKDFTRNPRLKENIQDEIMDFDRDGLSWINPTTFRLRLDVRCNPYEGDENCLTKVLRSYPARVSVSPFSISYTSVGQVKSATASRKPSARNAQVAKGVRDVDFLNFTYPRSLSEGGKEGITVKRGKYDNGKSDGDWEGFSVGPILYGDLTGDGQEEAIIFATSEWVGANPANSIAYGFYIYTLKDGKPAVLMMPDALDYWKDYSVFENANDECDGWIWGVKATNITQGILFLQLSVGGRHCVDEGYKVTMKYRWDGSRLILTENPIKRRVRARDTRGVF